LAAGFATDFGAAFAAGLAATRAAGFATDFGAAFAAGLAAGFAARAVFGVLMFLVCQKSEA